MYSAIEAPFIKEKSNHFQDEDSALQLSFHSQVGGLNFNAE